MSGTIAWTASLRADLAPTEPSKKKLDVNKTWSTLRTRFSTLRGPFKKGLTNDVARDAMEAALELLESKTFPLDATPLALGATLVFASNARLAHELGMLIAQSRDADVMVESVVVAHGLSFGYKYPASWLARKASDAPIAWRALRDVVLRDREADVRKSRAAFGKTRRSRSRSSSRTRCLPRTISRRRRRARSPRFRTRRT